MAIEFKELSLPGVILCTPQTFGDSRGFFMESFRLDTYQANGITLPFVQDNLSRSSKGTLRGLHYQLKHPQGKLVSVLSGSVLDVVVDADKTSATFGQSLAIELSEENKLQLYIPPGYVHGFQVLTDTADFFYKCTDYYAPDDQYGIRWNDPAVGIDWPISEPLCSDKDRSLPILEKLPLEDHPTVQI